MNGAGGETVHSFELFGSTVRILLGISRDANPVDPRLQALSVQAYLRRAHHALSRFEPESDLCRLNDDPATEIATDPLVAALVAAAIEAERDSDGLVDATVIGGVERAGYRRSRAGREPADLREALTGAPERRPARPGDRDRWRNVTVDVPAGRVTRPPGMRFDSGGLAKGMLADRCAATLGTFSTFAVDCGGDVRVGGADGLERRLEVGDPFSGESVLAFGLTRGAVATSGLRRRVWGHGDGAAHHLIDPGRGVPAWTGLVQATAIAPTALEAETLAKAALLGGPDGAEARLERWGGVVFADDGAPTVYGPLGDLIEPVREGAAA